MALFKKTPTSKKSSGGGLFKRAETKTHKRHGEQVPAAGFPTSEDVKDDGAIEQPEGPSIELGDRIELASSNLSWAEYDDSTQVLKIGFHSGHVWSYSGVPHFVAVGLTQAPSAGTFFNNDIRGRYAAVRVG